MPASPKRRAPTEPSAAVPVDDIIHMALSDHVSFEQIREQHGLSPDEVQALMRRELKRGSYMAWRKRVRRFSDGREFYKSSGRQTRG